jgi:nucleoside-diphosphate-sugar epimerase
LHQLQIQHVRLTSNDIDPSKRAAADVLKYKDFFQTPNRENLFGGDTGHLRLIHCAWRGLPDYSAEMCRWNFDFSQRLFQRAIDLDFDRIVGVGSCLEYGSLRGKVLENEVPLNPSAFGQTKLALSRELKELCSSHSVDYRWARIFYAYGPGQRSTSLIPSVVNDLALSVPVQVRSPNEVVDFVHVSDVARALVAMALDEGDSGVFNVGSGVPSRVSDISAALERFWAREPECKIPVSEDQNCGLWADMRKTRQYVSASTFLPLEQGLMEQIRLRREIG